MKDYNSIPFKNKAIDRLTRNTTIIPDSMTARPDTKFKEVTVKPSAQQVSDYYKRRYRNRRNKCRHKG